MKTFYKIQSWKLIPKFETFLSRRLDIINIRRRKTGNLSKTSRGLNVTENIWADVFEKLLHS